MAPEDGTVSRLSLGYSLGLWLSALGLVALSVDMEKVCSALRAGLRYLRFLNLGQCPVVYPGFGFGLLVIEFDGHGFLFICGTS
jgi:hypothetical protein